MKRFLKIILATFASLGLSAQTRQVINVGGAANDGTGDSVRSGFQKANANFSALWALAYTNSFVPSGHSYLTNDWQVSGGTAGSVTNSIRFYPVSTFYAGATNLTLVGYDAAGLNAPTLTIQADTEIDLQTPAVTAQTATTGQVLTLVDAATGKVEFSTVSATTGVNVKNYGATGDGTTDDTTAIQAAVAANYGAKISFPAGTYVVNSVTVTNSISLDLQPDAILKHKASASGDMFEWSGRCDGSITGGVFDGNKANQTDASLKIFDLRGGASCRFSGCTFQNYKKSGIIFSAMNGESSVTYCKFLDGAQHTGTVQEYSIGIVCQSAPSNQYNVLNVTGCTFRNSTTATYGKGGSALLIIEQSGGKTKCVATGNTFDGMGTYAAGNLVGSIELYEGADGSVISANTIRNGYTHGIRVQNSDNVTITGNTILNGAASSHAAGILWSGDSRTITPPKTNVRIRDNFVDLGSNFTPIRTTFRSRSSNVETLTFASPHGASVGAYINVTGTAAGDANTALAVVTAVTSTTLSYASTGADVASTADNGGSVMLLGGYGTNLKILNRARTSNVATLTTSGVPGVNVGDLITVTGMSVSSYNVTNATITATTTSSVSYASTGTDEATAAESSGAGIGYTGITANGIEIANTDELMEGVTITGNRLANVGHGILVVGTSGVLDISGNRINSAQYSGIEVGTSCTGQVVIAKNNVTSVQQAIRSVNSVIGLEVTDNITSSSGLDCLALDIRNAPRLTLLRNTSTHTGSPGTVTALFTSGIGTLIANGNVASTGNYTVQAANDVTRALLQISSDRGDSAVTLVAGTDAPVQRFATALTANRAITLSTTGVRTGDYFRIVRSGLGSFTLDVGGLYTIPSATRGTVEVQFNGSAWQLVNASTY